MVLEVTMNVHAGGLDEVKLVVNGREYCTDQTLAAGGPRCDRPGRGRRGGGAASDCDSPYTERRRKAPRRPGDFSTPDAPNCAVGHTRRAAL